MTVSDQLRSIADRLDAARAMKHEALDELAKVGRYVVQVLGASDEDLADSAAVPVAAGAGAEDGGGTSAVPVAPPCWWVEDSLCSSCEADGRDEA